MDELRGPLPFRFNFYVCKFLQTMYLFAPLDPVILNVIVIVTEKRRHYSRRSSQDRNLTVVVVEAYKQR